MIKAKHRNWAKYIFKLYIFKQFKKNFHSFKLIGDLPNFGESPILLLTNHSSWWDGFFTFYLNEAIFKKKYHIMMLEDQLEKYYFFQYLGAYSIKQESPKSIIESINYTKSLLLNNSIVNIYPEGKMDYSFKNNVKYKGGILKVLENNKNINLVHTAIKIIHLHNEKPEVFFSFENINYSDLKINNLENSMNTMLSSIDSNIDNASILFNGKKTRSE
ncbi:lysophospholipid acyltransferase family protein [Candidatus Kapabacteria bacterium]|nr:lysophospholipid acyltransferase family protein [Candidatus Kapabacteria bacterium]